MLCWLLVGGWCLVYAPPSSSYMWHTGGWPIFPTSGSILVSCNSSSCSNSNSSRGCKRRVHQWCYCNASGTKQPQPRGDCPPATPTCRWMCGFLCIWCACICVCMHLCLHAFVSACICVCLLYIRMIAAYTSHHEHNLVPHTLTHNTNTHTQAITKYTIEVQMAAGAAKALPLHSINIRDAFVAPPGML